MWRSKIFASRAGYAFNLNHRRSLHSKSVLNRLVAPAVAQCTDNFAVFSSNRTMNLARMTRSHGHHLFSTNSGGQNNEVKIDGVKVEVTKTSLDGKDSTTSGDQSAQQSGPKLKKNEQQQAEEELYMLQAHVKQHFQHANYTEALGTSEEILQKSTEIFGKNHPATASAYNNIGLMNKMMGDFTLSRENYHAALSIYEDITGKDHASYAAALNNLGNLDRSQSMTDEDLSSLQRMQLNDSAVDYFEEAWNIRKAELGEEHVYTVTSRSNLGGALAAQVLQGELMRQKKLKESKGKGNEDGKDAVWTVSQYTKEKWDVAEEHLRASYRTAVNNPRGEKVAIPSKETDSVESKRRDKNLSKKEKQKASKLRKKQEKQNTLKPSGNDGNGLGVGDVSICTLSSAAAAQNLAVFLKSRADLISNSEDADPSLDSDDMYAEAKNLYLGALRVRIELRGEFHPDTVATKFSLAELIEAVGDEAGANVLRQELLDAYEVEEHDDEEQAGGKDSQ
mmetsp:Transcript_11438/g.17150  ORF Transcript_11438/g.17150 Transcript_11438/m.17150 type:complete len:507 (-) Transcript_11438:16-1536(-)